MDACGGNVLLQHSARELNRKRLKCAHVGMNPQGSSDRRSSAAEAVTQMEEKGKKNA